MTKRENRSPIKNLPVRMAGQCLREQLDVILNDDLSPYLAISVMSLVMAGLEWYRYLTKAPYSPVIYTAMALIVIVVTARKIRKIRPFIRQLRLGIIGEEAVGQFLDEKLRPMGCQVFHDLLADKFNVDHIVVGPTGLFAVETKTWSKPMTGDCKVKYDGEQITVNGLP
jgi:hypothetical protein